MHLPTRIAIHGPAIARALELATLTVAVLTTLAAPVVADEPLFDTWRGFSFGSVDDAMLPSDGKIADFDNDGIADLAVVYWWQRPALTLMFGNGDGTYSEPTHYPAQVSYFLESGDFDNDGDEDIIVADWGDAAQLSTVSFYFNQGDGTFGPRQTHFVGRKPRTMTVADYDGDNDLDVAVAVIGTTNNPILDVAVIYNDGTGSFSPPSMYLGGDQSLYWYPLRPWTVTSGDLNGDSFPDLVVGHAYQYCSVLLNDGLGGFGPPATHFVGSGPWGIDNESGVALVDADHDDDLDIVFSCIYMRVYAEGDPGAVALFRNQGDGSLGPAEVIPLMTYSTGCADLEIADVTGDGWDDVLLAWEGGGEIGWGVLAADGAGGFGTTTRYPGGEAPTAICPVDIDGDLDIDIVAPARGSMMASVHLNPGNGDFSNPPVYPVSGFSKRHFDAGDIDNDGDLDLAFCGGGIGYDGWVQILHNNGDGTYGSPMFFEGMNFAANIKVRDLNSDGWLDLVWADDPQGPPYDFKTMLNNGDGTFGPFINWQVGTCGTHELQAIDVDNDDDLDIILGEYLTCFGDFRNYIYMRKNNGNGTFAPTIIIEGDQQGAWGITSGDYDEDGFVDLAVTNPTGVVLYRGNAAGNYGAYTTIPIEFSKQEIMTARFNQDEHDDLVIQGSSMWILLGRGDGTFDPPQEYEVDPTATTALDIGDADADGDTDVLITNYYAHDVSVFLNDGNAAFAPVRYGASGKTIDVLLRDFTGNGIQDIGLITTGDHLPFGVIGAQILPGTGRVTTSIETPEPSSPGLALLRVRPNPFAAATSLFYDVATPGHVEVAIFDVQGRRVRTLVDAVQAPGQYDVSWNAVNDDGGRAPAGIYFVRLENPSQVTAQKLVLTR